ncbi:MAG: hypothetical protein LIQ31_06370 [Planctomycetes bacterium]|nr:hypothetical protein [Planctomycetota bacterium]
MEEDGGKTRGGAAVDRFPFSEKSLGAAVDGTEVLSIGLTLRVRFTVLSLVMK